MQSRIVTDMFITLFFTTQTATGIFHGSGNNKSPYLICVTFNKKRVKFI